MYVCGLISSEEEGQVGSGRVHLRLLTRITCMGREKAKKKRVLRRRIS